MDTAFRKINIDAYDEDTILDTELYDADPRDPTTILSDAKQKANAVRSSLARSGLWNLLVLTLDPSDINPEVITKERCGRF